MKRLMIFGMAAMFALSGCASNTSHQDGKKGMSQSNMNQMHHSASGNVPKGLKKEKNPAYKVGSNVILKASHMKGMYGAKATIAGAYDTTAYEVSYTPVTGGKPVKNHKWVIQEEIKNAGSKPLKPGSKVTLLADHMKGMYGAKATIDSAEHTTVYMVNYKPTNGGKEVKNHTWVTESEITSQ